jgi:hypothetical protein
MTTEQRGMVVAYAKYLERRHNVGGAGLVDEMLSNFDSIINQSDKGNEMTKLFTIPPANVALTSGRDIAMYVFNQYAEIAARPVVVGGFDFGVKSALADVLERITGIHPHQFSDSGENVRAYIDNMGPVTVSSVDPADRDATDAVCSCGDVDCNRPMGHACADPDCGVAYDHDVDCNRPTDHHVDHAAEIDRLTKSLPKE